MLDKMINNIREEERLIILNREALKQDLRDEPNIN